MPTFDIRLFGAIEIRRDGTVLTNFRSQKALVLLAYLICANRPITRDYLAGLAWPEMEQSQALGLLRRSLHDLNHQLPGCLTLDRRTVCFTASAVTHVDVHTFANLMAAQDAEGWATAARLYRAPFLHGIYVDEAPELESWLLREQEHWQQAAIGVLQRLIQQYSAVAAYAQALSYGQQLLALEPWREEAQRQVMLLLARTGQVSAALAQHERCRQVLRAELEVAPDQATEILYRRLKALARTPSAHLPPATTRFVGREQELAQLLHLLAAPHCRLITLIGAGGMGKTRLALEVAQQMTRLEQRTFLHGVVFAALTSVAAPEQVVAALAQALAFTLPAQGDPEMHLLGYLQDKELLILLDNFEHLISPRTAAFVLKLLQTAPDVKLLITSRTRLNLQSEQLYWVQGLHFPVTPSPLSLDGTTGYSAVDLFITTAQRTHAHYQLRADDAPALVAICQLVQGMPLALELAATWTNVLALTEIADQIRQKLDFLASEAYDLPLRQRSMHAVFHTSWRLLGTAEQTLFAQLSLFRGGFTGAAAQAVAQAPLPLLLSLVNQSLVRKTADDRYELHELVRQYAADKLAQTPDGGNGARDRHTAYYADYLDQCRARSRQAEQPAAVAFLGELANIRLAWNWAVDQRQIDRLTQMMDKLCHFYGLYLHQSEGEAIFRLAAEKLINAVSPALSAAEQNVVATVCLYLAEFLMKLNQLAEAAQWFQQSLAGWQRLAQLGQDTRLRQAMTVRNLGRLAFPVDRRRAYTLFEQSLALTQTIDDLWIKGALFNDLADAAWNLGHYAEARRWSQQNFALHPAFNSKFVEGWSRNLLGVIVLHQGEVEEAETLQRTALALFEETDDPAGIACGLVHLGITLVWSGKLAEGERVLATRVALERDVLGQHFLAFAHHAWGEAWLHLGDYARAEQQAETSVALLRNLNEPHATGLALLTLGQARLAQGALAAAHAALQASEAQLRELGQRGALGWALAGLGYTAQQMGDQRLARQWLAAALQITVETGAFFPTLVALPAIALRYSKAGALEQGVELYTLAAHYGLIANSHWFSDMAGKLVAHAATALPASRVKMAQERGKARVISATTLELLRDL